MFNQIGADGFAPRARRALRATGESVQMPVAAPTPFAANLTNRKSHIGALVCGGHTNKIAAQPFIGPIPWRATPAGSVATTHTQAASSFLGPYITANASAPVFGCHSHARSQVWLIPASTRQPPICCVDTTSGLPYGSAAQISSK